MVIPSEARSEYERRLRAALAEEGARVEFTWDGDHLLFRPARHRRVVLKAGALAAVSMGLTDHLMYCVACGSVDTCARVSAAQVVSGVTVCGAAA